MATIMSESNHIRRASSNDAAASAISFPSQRQQQLQQQQQQQQQQQSMRNVSNPIYDPIVSPTSSPTRSILRTSSSLAAGFGGGTGGGGTTGMTNSISRRQLILQQKQQQQQKEPTQNQQQQSSVAVPLSSTYAFQPTTSLGDGSDAVGVGGGSTGTAAAITTNIKPPPIISNKTSFGGGTTTTNSGTGTSTGRVGFVRSTTTTNENNGVSRGVGGGGFNGNSNNKSAGSNSFSTSRITNKSQQQQPQYPHSLQPRFTFQGHARVFFQGKNDTSERQLKPSHCTSSGTNVLDSHIYVCVDAKSETLNLYPYKAGGCSSSSSSDYNQNEIKTTTTAASNYCDYDSEIHQLSVPLIIDPPIQLKYFDAELMPHSLFDVGLYVRNDPAMLGTNASTAHRGSFIKGTTATGASAGGGTTGTGPSSSVVNGISLEDIRRHVFRFEFRNDNVLQSYERLHKYNIAASKAAELTYHMGTMSSNINNATKNAFSSHDDIETSRQVERQKLKDACVHYLSVVQHMNKEVSRTARHFVKAANVVTISIPYSPPPTQQQQQPAQLGDGGASSPLRPNRSQQQPVTPLASNVLRPSGATSRQSYPPQQSTQGRKVFPNGTKDVKILDQEGIDIEEDLSSSDSDFST